MALLVCQTSPLLGHFSARPVPRWGRARKHLVYGLSDSDCRERELVVFMGGFLFLFRVQVPGERPDVFQGLAKLLWC